MEANTLVRGARGAISPRHFEDFGRWYTTRFVRQRGRRPSARTIEAKLQKLSTTCNYLERSQRTSVPQDGVTILHGILGDRDKVEHLIDRLLTRQTSGAVRQTVYALADYSQWLVVEGVLERALVHNGDAPPMNPPPPITVYTDKEMETFVSAARGVNLRWWALIATLADTGRRVGELLEWQWAWFNMTAKPPHVQMPSSKNGEQQYVPLTRRLADEVFTPENRLRLQAEAPPPRWRYTRDPQVFVFPWHYTSAIKRFHRFCDTLGIDDRGFHNFRHSVITARLAAGMPPQAVQALAGHKSLQTTMSRYAHATALDYWKFVEPPEEVAG